MFFQWLKRYMPRGIYARAALILVLPVLTLQLVVSVVFIQRHFEGVSDQMTRGVARDISYALSNPDAAGPLGLSLREVPQAVVPEADLRRWFDFSGIVVTRTLRRFVDGVEHVALPNDTDVSVLVRGPGGSLREVEFSRARASASNPHQLLVNMVFFGMLITLISYLYLRNQLRPITRLAQAAEAFGRGRHVPYSPGGAVEVRAAGSAFLDMRNRIERQIEQRTMMLSGVSHDLRTPLTRLRLGLSLLEDEDREPLERDVEDMQQLIDAFLDFARGNAQMGEPEPTDPVALARSVVEDARRAGRAVTLVRVEGAGQVVLRPAALRRALENLVNNAVRYGSRCEVSLTLTDKSLRFRVEDDGPGIPPESRDDAIRPFVRLDPARNQDRGTGVGLGLAIAADIARAHGGVLRLGSSDTLGGLRADVVIAR
ncbi:ATP-binding protein [Salipiger marinus]|jgi:two-component system, OmpR family, osmolarity sensor histidine kinase EnvZ|uniref:histidine kinase n=1 Tax=Salipiger marinus TaxID=555512 RepID=A0A1G8TM70_9RHOB|nr:MULTISPECIES: ATP-binding protein [Salipiger]MCD1619523.1 HAMP domain-containing protein [Salipiger manganoxidans]MEB3420357.1 ATP-binding protein [Salipiger manganoxidans]SDJ42659.1 two-component system, OmpR family, osmolarity sensor histidine kinase EnvZ [Salipiger marinus]HBM58273.1 HAMP domain-containing protein [Citreicella sp.]